LQCLGYACGDAGVDKCAEKAPLEIKPFILQHKKCTWLKNLHPEIQENKTHLVAELCTRLAQQTKILTRDKKFFCVFGGDHSSAIGTWSGVAGGCDEDFGLIWIDAHMDCHTFSTSASKNIHGMPVAALLGKGDSALTQIITKKPKIHPKNLHLIGIRDYEPEEPKLLDELGASVFYADNVNKIGVHKILTSSVESILKNCKKFGISLDIDSIDPSYAPGVSTPSPNGLNPDDLIESLAFIKNRFSDNFIGIEITEFNPCQDKNDKTKKIIHRIIDAIA
jgi:arginase